MSLAGKDLEVAASSEPVATFQVVWQGNQGGGGYQNFGLSYGAVSIGDNLYTGETTTKLSGGYNDRQSLKIYKGNNLQTLVTTKYEGKYEVMTWDVVSTSRDPTVDNQNNNCCNANNVIRASDGASVTNTLRNRCTDIINPGSHQKYFQSTLSMFPTYTLIEVVDPWFDYVALLGGFMAIVSSGLGIVLAGLNATCYQQRVGQKEPVPLGAFPKEEKVGGV